MEKKDFHVVAETGIYVRPADFISTNSKQIQL